MIYYLIINLLIIVVGLFVPERINIRSSSTHPVKEIPLKCILLFGVLFVFLGFRGNFTTDYDNYSAYFVRIYENISFRDIFSHSFEMEFGFILISKLIGCFTHSILVYHAILSFGLLLLFFRIYKKHSALLWLSLLLFVNLGDYFGAMNLFRQVLAAAIIFSGFEFIVQKKYLSFLWLVIIAMTIHTTALVMLICYFILTSKRTAFWNIGFGIAGIFVWIFLPSIVNLIGSIFSKYADYHYGMGQGSVNAVVAILVIYIFAEISINFFLTDYQRNEPLNLVLLNGTFLCLMFLILGVRIYMLTRIAYFFRPFVCLLVPNILSYYSDKRIRNVFIVVIAVFCILYTQLTLSGTGYDPYYFYSGGV